MSKSSFSTFVSSLTISLILFISLANAQEESLRGIDFDTIRDGIVHVGVKVDSKGTEFDWRGTGFVIDSSCTFVTAKHVLRNVNPEQLVIRFQIPRNRGMVRTLSARIVYQHETKDIAFLRIDTYQGQPCTSGELHVFSMYKNVLVGALTGKEVLIAGHPSIAGDDIDVPIVRQGIVASTEISWKGEPMILLDLQGVPGFSGSPVILKETGEVVGIVFGPGPTKRVFGFEWATPISLEDYRVAIEAAGDRN